MVTGAEINAALVAKGVHSDRIAFYDQEYVLPTRAWITEKLGPALDKFFFDTGISFRWEQFECNKYAKTASTIADWCWAKTGPREAALAFGVFTYGSEGGRRVGPHTLNIAIHRDESGKLFPAFYEPMRDAATVCMTPVELSDSELSSSFACLFL